MFLGLSQPSFAIMSSSRQHGATTEYQILRSSPFQWAQTSSTASGMELHEKVLMKDQIPSLEEQQARGQAQHRPNRRPQARAAKRLCTHVKSEGCRQDFQPSSPGMLPAPKRRASASEDVVLCNVTLASVHFCSHMKRCLTFAD